MQVESMEEYLRSRLKVELLKLDRLRAVATIPPDLQGPPAAGHGGGTTALLLEMARMVAGERGGEAVLPRPLVIDVSLHHEMPLDTPVRAEVEPAATGWSCRLTRADRLIAEATVSPGAGALEPPPSEVRQRWADRQGPGLVVPRYEWCLGCGLRNPRGAQTRFVYDQDFMWQELAPQDHFRCADGALAYAFACIVTDELGWWMGALRQGECGLSSRVRLTLGGAVRHAGRLLALGDRRAVSPVGAKGRVWATRAMLLTEDWRPVAAADVQFSGSRAFTRDMLPLFVSEEGGESLRRAFPRYADQIGPA